MTSIDYKDHYGVVIVGAGFSGLAMAIQLKQKLGYDDAIVYDTNADVGGTWYSNTYPGAASDIPIHFYSYSFARSADFTDSWPGQPEIIRYIRNVRDKFNVNNICFRTAALEARFSAETKLWTLEVKDLATGQKRTRTCNVLISAVGGLREPSIPEFARASTFKGEIFHSARWNHDVDLEGKKVVIVGNGCSAAQIIPRILDETANMTQICRSRQTVVPLPQLSKHPLFWAALRWVPGFQRLLRCLIFLGTEAQFGLSHIKDGVKLRKQWLDMVINHIQSTAPQKHWGALTPDFDLSAKRRVFDNGYTLCLNDPKFDLVADDFAVELKEGSVVTKKGVEVPADVLILCTGFRVQDFMLPLVVYNAEGESLVHRLKESDARMYRGTFASDFPNFAIIQGPNTATGHSSVVFTSECQINLAIKVMAPILAAAKDGISRSVTITREAEMAYYKRMREEMKLRVWEKDGGVSWYVNDKGLCTALYPWSQVNFWWHTLWPVKSHYRYEEAVSA